MLPSNLGARAETLALNIYLKKGHQLIAKNFKTKFGEIDLVTQKNNILYLVEVKSSSRYIENLNPYQKWNLVQKTRLVKAFKYYLADNLPNIYDQIEIHFIWFALDKENRLKLVCFNNEIEIDYG